MKKKGGILILLMFFVLSGCNSIESQMSVSQAKKLVLKYHNQNKGEIKIVSVTTKLNKYLIKWENKETCEGGTDSVNKKGEIKVIVRSIC